MFRTIRFFLVYFTLASACVYANESEDVSGLKAEIDSLREEVQALKERLARSIEDQKKIATERDRLKTELQELKKKPSEQEDAPIAKQESLPLNSKWKGKIVFTTNAGQQVDTVELTILDREKNTFTMELKTGGGVIWELDCDLKRSDFKIVGVRRIKGANGLDPDKLGPVAGITGSGKIVKGTNLKMEYLWPRPNGNPGNLHGRLDVTLEQ